MNQVFRRTAESDYTALLIADAIESFPDCEIITINRLESGYEIWARYDKDAGDLEVVDMEIQEALGYFDV